MKRKKSLVKYSYLLRLIIIVTACLFIPVLVLNLSVVRSSYRRMEEDNRASYLRITQYSAGYFNEHVSMLCNHALNMSLDRKIVRSNIEKSEWNTIKAVSETLVDYKVGVPMVKSIGVYFKGADYVLTTNYKYSLRRFMDIESRGNKEVGRRMKTFLTSGHKERTVLLSTFDTFAYPYARLYVGVPVSINDADDTMIFYVLDYTALKTSFIGTLGYENYGLFILDSGDSLLYANGNIDAGIFQDTELKQFLSDPQNTLVKYTWQQNSYNIFKFFDAVQGKMFLSVIPQDDVEKSLNSFYETIQSSLLFLALGLILLFAMSVYLSYKPIYRLSQRIGIREGRDSKSRKENGESGSTPEDRSGRDEIAAIEMAFDRLGSVNEELRETVTEQRMQLMDLVLNKLLSGEQPDSSDLEWLSSVLSGDAFCVLSVTGLEMNNVQRELLADEILSEFQSHVFLVDMMYDRHTVFVCAIPGTLSPEEVTAGIVETLRQSEGGGKVGIGAGNPVTQLSNIRSSYLRSLQDLDMDSGAIVYDDLMNDLSITEMDLTEETLSFLQHMKNGEKEDALDDLATIRGRISGNVSSVLVERYVCYKMMDAFLRTLKQIGMPLNQQEMNRILYFNNITEMCELLTPAVVRVCDSIAHTKSASKDQLNDSIVKFVDIHFTDPNLSLLQIADHYHISIYTLSRLFKEITGIGFKDYVTGKRIELARHLLMTTEKKVGDIAAEIGFGSVSHFNRVFKANCGMSPSKYKVEAVK